MLLIVASFVAALGVAAGGTLLYVYDQATAIDRSTPQVVVEQFLDATLILNNSDRVSLFVCKQWSAEAALLAVAPPTDKRVAVSGAVSLLASLPPVRRSL